MKVTLEICQYVPTSVESIFLVEDKGEMAVEFPKETRHLIQLVTAGDMRKISAMSGDSEVLVVANQLELTPKQADWTLVLDGIRDPGNLGAIIRIADWFGFTQLVVSTDTVDLYNPKVIQATMGSFLRVSVVYQELSTFLAESSVPIYGAILGGQQLHEVTPGKQGILVIGSESHGIRQEVLQLVSHPVMIPRYGGAESLNASVATGILAHWIRATG